jgi:hypothetical protein
MCGIQRAEKVQSMEQYEISEITIEQRVGVIEIGGSRKKRT